MPPLTLAILTSLLHIQGVDATVSSDNKGVEHLLTAIRGQLQERVDPNLPPIIEASDAKHYYKNYTKGFARGTYTRFIHIAPNPAAAPIARPGSTAPMKPEGGKRR